MPRAQISTALVYFSFLICSGAMYYFVPAMVSISALFVDSPKSANLITGILPYSSN